LADQMIVRDQTSIRNKVADVPAYHYGEHVWMTGRAEGGVLDFATPAGARDVDVTEGEGFIADGAGALEKIVWAAETLTASDTQGVHYIYGSTGGTLNISTTAPSMTVNVMLGTVFVADVSSTNTIVQAMEHRPDIFQMAAKKHLIWRDYRGSKAVSGLATTENGTTAFQLDIATGVAYIGDNRHAVPTSAQTSIGFVRWYSDGSSGWSVDTGQTTVSKTLYDDGSGTLASIPAAKFAKHVLWATHNDAATAEIEFHLVMATATYDTVAQAQAGNAPAPPAHFLKWVFPLAEIIVGQASSTIDAIVSLVLDLATMATEPGAPQRVRSTFTPALGTSVSNRGDFRTAFLTTSANLYFTFWVPSDFGELVDVGIILIPEATNASANVDLTSDYALSGEAFNTNSESDTSITYSWVADDIEFLSIASVFSSLEANHYCGVLWDQTTAGSNDILGVLLIYATTG